MQSCFKPEEVYAVELHELQQSLVRNKREKETACIVKYIKINFQTHLKKNLKRKMEFKSQGDQYKD